MEPDQKIEENEENPPEPSIEIRFLCMKLRYWWYLMLFFQHTLVVWMIGCLGTRRWVRQGDDETEWEGGLFYVETGWPQIAGESYYKLKDKSSLLNEQAKDTFKNLYSGAEAYAFFELLSLILLTVWIIRVIFHLMEKRFCANWVSYLWPSLGFFCHLLGLLIWAGVSDSGYEADCKDVSDKKVCCTNGPTLSVLTCLLWIFYGSIYIFVFLHRNGIEVYEEKDVEGEKEQRL